MERRQEFRVKGQFMDLGCDERMYLAKKQKILALGHSGSLSVAAQVVINSQIQVLCVSCTFLESVSGHSLQPRGRQETVPFKTNRKDREHFTSSDVCIRIRAQTDLCLFI